MNILIVGEFSGFAKHLKYGFTELGHDVMILQNGDGYKRIPYSSDDFHFSAKYVTLFGYKFVHSHVLFNSRINKQIEKRIAQRFQKKIDLIIVINYRFLRNNSWRHVGVSLSFLQKQIENGSKLIMSCCGSDPAFRIIMREMNRAMGGRMTSKDLKDNRFDFLIQHSHAIIPITLDYKIAITEYCRLKSLTANITQTVPLPMSVIPKVHQNSCIGRKIVVFHGINRPQAKGTPYIVEAMNKLAENYNDLVVCIAKGRMPYEEYCALFDGIDILIDQTYGKGMGVNAAIGLMNGKVVLGGNSKESEEDLGCGKCPIINIEPNVEQIYSTLVELITNPPKIEEIKQASREYALTYIDSVKIAMRYIKLVI